MELAEVFELSSLDYFLLVLLAILVWRWLRRKPDHELPPPPPPVPKMKMQDMTLAELRPFDGVQKENILFALNGTIYDVTRGRSFYGPDGPYGALAGHDATRALATMSTQAVSDEWDDHEDLKADEKEAADEWEASFKYKYPTVGRLVKDAAEKIDYGDAETKVASWMQPAAANKEGEDKKNE